MTTQELDFRDAIVAWANDPDDLFWATIAIGKIDDPENHPYDERVFFYVDNESEFDKLFEPNNGEEFYLIANDDADLTLACRKCSTPVVDTAVLVSPGYDFACLTCDEDLYAFETYFLEKETN